MAYLANRICSSAAVGGPYGWGRDEIFGTATRVLGDDYQTENMNKACRNVAWQVHRHQPLFEQDQEWQGKVAQGARVLAFETQRAERFEASIHKINTWLSVNKVKLLALRATIRALRRLLAESRNDNELQEKLTYAHQQFDALAQRYETVKQDRDDAWAKVINAGHRFSANQDATLIPDNNLPPFNGRPGPGDGPGNNRPANNTRMNNAPAGNGNKL